MALNLNRNEAAGGHYRPDIDGLRAVAILPVLLYHYKLGPFGGGFVGVDVFFVISGYLITSLIHAEMEQGRFSIAGFYERRVRRIFPALFALLLAATVVAFLVLFPDDFARYAKSLLATAGFGSNFEFWREAGYFDVAAQQKPLLHLWSIAVEEQFYLLFPVILLLARRMKWTVAIVAAIFVVSLGLSIWGVEHAPTATFYLLPARAWELMLGALLALGAIPQIENRVVREAASLIGLALIAIAVFIYTDATKFPGLAALLPCVGTALIIWSGQDAGVNRALSWQPLVFIGLISYSLYLWHWPLYVFARDFLFRDLTLLERCGLIVASFALATFSLYFIERPFRRKDNRVARPVLFGGALATMAVTAVCAGVVLQTDGLPQRLPPNVQTILAEETDHEPRMARCFGLTAQDVRDGKLCRFGDPHATPDFVLWGDSHADAMLPAVRAIALREHRAGWFAGTDSCAPLLGMKRPDAWKCFDFNNEIIKLATQPGIKDVILDARWAKNAEGTAYGDEGNGRIAVYDDRGEAKTTAQNEALFFRALSRTVRALTIAHKRVILIESVPEIGWAVPAVLAHDALTHRPLRPGIPWSQNLARQHYVLYAFAQMKACYPDVALVNPQDVLCDKRLCHVALNGRPLYRDEHHLSNFGAMQIVPLIAKVF
jgi:peptidoglycan/LPS O-acetylase OafA/YrhL